MRRLPGWIVVLAGAVLLTVAACAAYVAAPFDLPPGERSDTGAPGLVEPERRIVAVRTDGSLVVLDALDGTLSEVVLPGSDADIGSLEVGAHREVAYVARADVAGGIDAVRLAKGTDEHRAPGRRVAVGPITFPQLARTMPRPEVERMAYVATDPDGDVVVVENLTTGDRRRFGPSPTGEQPFRSIDDLVLSHVGNRLLGVADDGATIFRLDLDRMSHLGQAATAPVPGGGRIVAAAAFGEGLAAVVRDRAGDTELVEIDATELRVRKTLAQGATIAGVRELDSDAAAAELLLVTDDHRLLRFEPASGKDPRALAEDVRLAAW